MANINIVIKNTKTLTYQRMLSLADKTELNICVNINQLNHYNGRTYLQIETIGFSEKMTELDNEGWTSNDGLYDGLILEYNNRPDIDKLLTPWVKG